MTDFLEITGFDVHRGCLALVERPPLASVADVLIQAQLVVVLEDVANADNVGGVFRSAAAFGAGAVLLSPGCCDPLYRKAVRTSMAATLTVPFSRLADCPGLEPCARGFAMVALTPGAPGHAAGRFVRGNRLSGSLCWLVRGGWLTAPVSDGRLRVRIPIRPEVDSWASVAAGIAL